MKFNASLSCESSFAILYLSEYVAIDMVMCIGGLLTEDIPLSLPILHLQCLMLCDGLGLTSSFVVFLFLLPLWSDFILVCFRVVVCIVLRITVCLYVSHFSSCSGQRLSGSMHKCSSSLDKEVRSSVLEGCFAMWTQASVPIPLISIREHCPVPRCDETLHDAPREVSYWTLVFYDRVEAHSSATAHSSGRCFEVSVFYSLQ